MKKRAFSLIEILVVVFIFSVGIGAIFVTINNTVNSFSLATNRVVASNLAIEGIEFVKNHRDNNLLTVGRTWDQGIISPICPTLNATINKEETLNGIEFTRTVTIASCANKIKISSIVDWTDIGGIAEREIIVMKLFKH